MNAEQRQSIIKLQATLTKISVKANVFFNVAQFVSMGLVTEYGKTIDSGTRPRISRQGRVFLCGPGAACGSA